MPRPTAFAFATALSLLGLSAQADPVVVELFTSQGCSSCPPADAILGEIAAREDVIALSLHVDYWDWIGWDDTFADPAFTERQRGYARAAHSNVLYTPQFVVGGTDQMAGASGMKLMDLVAEHREVQTDVLRMATTARGREVLAMPVDGGGQIVLVTYRPEATVRVLRGELAGRDITYRNVVQGWTPLAEWDGSELAVVLPDASPGLRQVVIAQVVVDGRPGRVIGAVRAD